MGAWTFPPVAAHPDELADLAAKTSTVDAAYITAGVLTPRRWPSTASRPRVVARDFRWTSTRAAPPWRPTSPPAAGDAHLAPTTPTDRRSDRPGGRREIPRDAGGVDQEELGLAPRPPTGDGEAGKTFFTAPEATHAAEMDAMRAEVARSRRH